ncbi:MAG: hypothetical protein WAO03_08945 [Petrimonas mucosa]|uniref:hypothetical protein n=1 Tax=Petrimonas TaxID=307628 RepID=UPI000B81658C|nr:MULTISPECIES: hypothetical protein [Petrimonas]MDD3561640.1 hypothetical protein [Petrimonas mucosa]
MDRAGITFIYLPRLFQDGDFQRMIAYHLPYIGHSQIDLAALTLRIKQNYCIKSDHPTLAYIAERELGDEGYEVRFPLEKITRENLDQSIDAIIEEIAQHKSRNWLLAEEEPFIKHIAYSPLFKSESKEYAKGKGDDKITADENFEKMAFQVPEDLMEGIMKLQTAGYLSRLIEFLEELQRSTRKLSRLRIASDFRIYLMDYDMMEVKMSPLPKAVYLLFLRHPEGILFKELPDYRTELMEIYKRITFRENPDKAKESIIRVTDPYDNSINEKCSLISIAFLKVVSEEIAENYYITGLRGEPKKIALSRELVIYE